MLRFFNLFGKSSALNALDDALRACGVHPALVPEAVKLTVVRLCKDEVRAQGLNAAYDDAARLLAYCIHGRETFAESNGPAAADEAEARLEAAIAAGDSMDAKLILLTLHSDVVAPEVADRLDIVDQ